jgi:hypothetical protein
MRAIRRISQYMYHLDAYDSPSFVDVSIPLCRLAVGRNQYFLCQSCAVTALSRAQQPASDRSDP